MRALGWAVEIENRGAWFECWVQEGDASWLGRGETASQACDHALRQMVPSAIARAWVVGRLDLTAAEPAAEPAAEAHELDEPPVSRILGKVELPSSTQAKAAQEDAPEDRAEALALLHEILDEIRWSGPELGELAPRRMQLTFVVWIGRARAIERSHRNDPAITEAVHQIARGLSDHAARFWPGSVPALQFDSTPGVSARSLRLAADRRLPATWTELAQAAQEALENDEALATLDDDGWADRSACTPAPSAPDDRFGELWDELVTWTGPIERAAPEVEPDEHALKSLRAPAARIARWLRWLRGATASPEDWGRAFGRLRWLSTRFRWAFPELSEALDRRYCPPMNWSTQLGLTPSSAARATEVKEHAAAQRQLAIKSLHAALPQTQASSDVWTRWFLEAFEQLDNPDILHLLDCDPADAPELTDRFSAISAESFEDPRFRRRWRHLTQAPTESAEDPEEPSDAQVEAAESAPDTRQADDAADPHAALRDAARGFTRGRRMLFVSNRTDPDLAQRIEDLLLPESLSWTDNRDHALDAQAERIRAGSYDLVIAATGFLSHSVDRKIGSACQAASIPYVRAARGRELACLRAVLRDVGGMLDPATEVQQAGLDPTATE